MNYNHPDMVRSPRGYVEQIMPLYDGGEEGCSIAILKDCNGYDNIGIRWNVSEKEWYDKSKIEERKICVGMPQSRGYSVWFILPDTSWKFVPQMINNEIALSSKPNLVTITEEQIQKAVNTIMEERFGK